MLTGFWSSQYGAAGAAMAATTASLLQGILAGVFAYFASTPLPLEWKTMGRNLIVAAGLGGLGTLGTGFSWWRQGAVGLGIFVAYPLILKSLGDPSFHLILERVRRRRTV